MEWLGEMKVGKKWIIALRGITVGGVFIFIRFYGLEKHCHAYQLELEQMVQCGWMFRLLQMLACVRPGRTDRGNITG